MSVDDASSAPSPPTGFNLLDSNTFSRGHPWKQYDEMRARGGLVRHPSVGETPAFWVATNHGDIQKISHDPVLFSSTEGFNMPTGGRLRDPAVVQATGRNILSYEPTEHAEFKHILLPAFSAANLKKMEARTHEFVVELVASMEGRTAIEFVHDIAAVIPIRVLCNLLGIPREDESKILEWTNRMLGVDDPELVPDPQVALQAFMEVFAYGKWLIEKKRDEPADDLMSIVAQSQLKGGEMDEATRNGLCAILVAAGNETTRNAITGSIVLLSQNPDQRERLVAQPALINSAIDEILRRVTPVIHMSRTATQDTEIAGQAIAAGEKVAMLYGAANHDPTVFEDPYRFDIERANARKHLAFGMGIHLCIGQRLAQMELRVLLTELLGRYPKIHATGGPTYLRSNFVSSIKTLPVALH